MLYKITKENNNIKLLSSNNISNTDCLCFIENLHYLRRLRELKIKPTCFCPHFLWNCMTLETKYKIFANLKYLVNLQVLKLEGVEMDDSLSQVIEENLKFIPNIRVIKFNSKRMIILKII